MKAVARFALFALLGLTLPACDKEDPTTVGAPLVENGAVRTFEVTLNASDFLVRDTSFSSYPPAANSSFVVLARSYEGVLNANALFRFKIDPILGLADSAGNTVVDSTPKLLSGRLILRLDTIASRYPGPVQLRLYRAAESWDTSSVTWRVRQNTNGVPVLWTTPGGTKGALIDTVTYTGASDSVVFRVDTITLARWRDSGVTDPGAIITVETPDTRLRSASPLLRVDFRTSKGDTTVTQSTFPFASRFIADPTIPAVSPDPRAGGLPTSFRTVFELKPDLANLQVPCPFSTTCRVRLKDASIASAHILLEATASAPGYAPEVPITVVLYSLLPTAQLPLIRSPLGSPADPNSFTTLAPSSFTSTNTAVTAIAITRFLREQVAPIDTTTFQSRYLSLLQGGTVTFGYASFRGQPRLRLRLSVAQETQLP